MRRDLGPGDFSPAGDQFTRGKPLFRIGVGKYIAQQDGQRFGGDRTGLEHGWRVCVHKTMTLAGAATRRKKASPRDRENTAPDRPALLLGWYDRHRRRLPWRPLPGVSADPYRVWLSEIMLQQTSVQAVGPYFEKFLNRWPSVEALGSASLDDVLRMWAGLGYYSRARNLHACAVAVKRDHGG